MSDQLFVGTAPSAEAGKEVFFYSLDIWIELATCVLNTVYDDFPCYPTLDAAQAPQAAIDIRAAIDAGRCRDFFEWSAGQHDEEAKADAIAADAEMYLGELRRFVAFLETCGGCRPG